LADKTEFDRLSHVPPRIAIISGDNNLTSVTPTSITFFLLAE
jgi:hypothetical protein